LTPSGSEPFLDDLVPWALPTAIGFHAFSVKVWLASFTRKANACLRLALWSQLPYVGLLLRGCRRVNARRLTIPICVIREKYEAYGG
jgi:hypothetical protein